MYGFCGVGGVGDLEGTREDGRNRPTSGKANGSNTPAANAAGMANLVATAETAARTAADVVGLLSAPAPALPRAAAADLEAFATVGDGFDSDGVTFVSRSKGAIVSATVLELESPAGWVGRCLSSGPSVVSWLPPDVVLLSP